MDFFIIDYEILYELKKELFLDFRLLDLIQLLYLIKVEEKLHF